LNSITTVDFIFTFIILPDDSELDDSFGDLKFSFLKEMWTYSDNGNDFLQLRTLFEKRASFEGGEDFISRLHRN
jgi:hypothetical protein